MAALPASLLTRGKAGSAHIFHSSSHAGRLTGSVSSHRSAVQQQVVISLWFWQYRKPFMVSHKKLNFSGCSVFVSAVAICQWKSPSGSELSLGCSTWKKSAVSVLLKGRERADGCWMVPKVPEGNLLCECRHQLQPLHFPVSAWQSPIQGLS